MKEVTKDLEQLAITIATSAHAGQFDKAGKPYILHPLRVMNMLTRTHLRIIAVLHDVLEDSAMDCGDLLGLGFPHEIVQAVVVLTKGDDETYNEYLRRIKLDNMACAVKFADLEDNLNSERLAVLPEDTRKYLEEKYKKAQKFLEGDSEPILCINKPIKLTEEQLNYLLYGLICM